MTLVMFLTWLAVAVVTGRVASAAMKDGGHGMMADTLLALTGAGVVIAVQRTFYRGGTSTSSRIVGRGGASEKGSATLLNTNPRRHRS